MKRLVLGIALLGCASDVGQAAIQFSGSYSQNFDSLASVGTDNTWANDSTISGWFLFRQPGPGTAITTYTAGSGSSTEGSFYSFGSSGSGERALGGVGSGGTYFGSPSSGSVAGWIAVSFINQSGGTLGGFQVTWNGEQWRDSGNVAQQTMQFQYGFGTDFTTVDTWNAPAGTFDWNSPVASGTAAQVDGNNAGRINNVGGTISSLTWNDGDTLWIRWIERNDSGNDHGLAIDDFTLTAVPEPKEWGLICALGLLGIAALRTWRQRRTQTTA